MNYKAKILISLLFLTFSEAGHADPVLLSSVFAINSLNDTPVENLETSSFQNERLYVFLYFNKVEPKKLYQLTSAIYDGMDNLVATYKGVLYSNDSVETISYKYNFKPQKDFPGDWKIIVYLGGKKYFEKAIYVSE